MTAQESLFPSFDEIITHIYQGSLEDPPWQDFLDCLRQRLKCDSVALVFQPTGSNDGAPYTLYKGALRLSNEAFGKAGRSGLADYANPLFNALVRPGDVMNIDQVIPRAQLAKSAYYREVMQPHDIEYMMAIHLAGNSGASYFLCLLRGPLGDNFSRESREHLLALRPHLEHAFKSHGLLKRYKQERQIYDDVLNRLTIGTIILDGSGRVLQVNDAAQQVLEQSSCIALNEGRLLITKSRHREEFNRLLGAAVAWHEQRQPGNFVEALRIENSNSPDLGLLIRTLPSPVWYQSVGQPCVVIHIDDFEQDQSAPDQIIARLFRLTRSEARLAAMLADGFTLAEAAIKLNLSESSVRTYSKKIFAKMGVGRQAELVRTIVKSIAALARPDEGAARPSNPNKANTAR